MDIFNAVSKQIDSVQSYSPDYNKTSNIQKRQEISQNRTTTSSEVKNKQDKKEIQRLLMLQKEAQEDSSERYLLKRL